MTDPVPTIAPAATTAAPAEGEIKPAMPATELGKTVEPPKAGEPAKPEPTKSELTKETAKAADAPAPFEVAKLTLPEGMKSDDPLLKTYSDIMSDDKLPPQERGQKLIDLYHGAIKQAGEANTLAWQGVNDGWIKEVKADPEIGGAKFDQTKTTIARAIDMAGSEKAAAFRQALDMTGAGNNPAVWRVLAHWAGLLTEGKHVTGNPSGSSAAPAPKDFFPNSKMS